LARKRFACSALRHGCYTAMRMLFLLACFVLLPQAGSGRERLLEKWRWRIFTPKNGLPERNFSTLFQARIGLYYAASSKRVFQYDGYRWQEIAFGDPLGPRESIATLTEDQNGIIFAATDRGIWAFRLGDAFRQVYRGRHILVGTSPDRQVYFLSGGYLHRLEGTRVHRLQAVEPVPANRIWALAVDSDQLVWVGTDRGLFYQEGLGWRRDPDLRTVELDGRPCRGLFLAAGVRLWANIYHPERGWVLVQRANGKWRLPGPGGPQTPVLALAGYSDGAVYASTEEGGLYRYGPQAQWRYVPRLWPGSVVVVAAIVDDRQALWLSLRAIGIARFDARGNRWETLPLGLDLRRNRVRALLRARDGVLWVATENGLLRRAAGVNQFFEISPAGSISLRSCTGLAEDRKGRIWVVSATGFAGALVIDGKHWSRYRLPPPYEEVHVRRVEKDKFGRLWFLAAEDDLFGGAWCYDGGSLRRFGTDQGLLSDRVLAVEAASDGSLWFGTDRGLVLLSDSEAAEVRYFTQEDGLVVDRVWDIAQSSDESIWIAYQVGGGVSRYLKGKWYHYGSAEGLSNENVWSIASAPGGDVWFGTQGGLSRFDGTAFYNYEIGEEPLISSAWPLIPLPNEKGVLLGAPAGGVFCFRLTDSDPPGLFPLANPRQFPPGQPIRLSWGGRDRFDQTPPEDLLYLVRLDGGPWSPPRKENTFATANLPCGEHLLEVRAKDLDGNEAVFPLQISFRVVAPWYRRTAVLLGAALFLLLLAGVHLLLFSWRLRAEETRRLLENMLEEKGFSLICVGRTGNIAAILGAAPEGFELGGGFPEEAAAPAARMSSKATLTVSGETWEISELGGNRKYRFFLLSPGRSAPSGQLPEELAAQVEALAARKFPGGEPPAAVPVPELVGRALRELPESERSRVSFAAPVPEALWAVKVSRSDCVEILKELLLNALQADPQRQVTIEAANRRLRPGESPERAVEITVLDEGPGLPADSTRLFQPFFSTKPGHEGLGLSIALGLARRNGAQLVLENRPGGGARASLLLPAQSSI